MMPKYVEVTDLDEAQLLADNWLLWFRHSNCEFDKAIPAWVRNWFDENGVPLDASRRAVKVWPYVVALEE